jgi:hypothetical protein
MLVIACVALFSIGSAQAVHDLGFQLDGDVSHACPSGNALPLCTSSQKDWADLFNVNDTSSTETVSNSSAIDPTNGPFTNATFTRDFESGSSCALNSTSTTFCTGDDTTFATGSKDTLDITGWQCNHDNNVNSKIDIMNAYAAAYKDPASGDTVLYFGLEKNKDNGTNDVGFWFLQGNASCSAPSGHQSWSGKHTVGDVLVVSEFTNGGGVSNITAYKWIGGSSPLQQIGTAGDCKISAGVDTMCATTNSGSKPFNTTLTTPWLTSDATAGIGRNQIVPPDFFEGGIDITQAFKQTSGAGPAPSCFNTFIADTRSSNVTSATLFDYARGQLGQCSSTLSTQQNAVSGSATSISIGTGTVSSGTDTATMHITGTTTWGGTLTWYLCGPSVTSCDNSGLLVTSKSVSNSDNTSTYTSGTATLTSAGTYCWHAHFEPNDATKNAGLSAADDDGTNECFTVSPVTPTLSTSAVDSSGSTLSGPVDFGSAVYDKAGLTGTANKPASNGIDSKYGTIICDGSAGAPSGTANACTAAGTGNGAAAAGSITFKLYGPSASTTPSTTECTTLAKDANNVSFPSTGISVSVSGDSAFPPGYPSANPSTVTFTPGSAGYYFWKASYSGDSPNTTGAPLDSSGNVIEHNADCSVSAERVQIQQIPTDIKSKQSWYPNDTATITSTITGTKLGAGGTVDFTLYDTATCTGNVLYTERQTLAGGNQTEEVGTHNFSGSTAKTPGGANVTAYLESSGYADAAGSTVGPNSWKVVYTPATGDTAHLSSSSTCQTGHTEKHTITYTNDPGH